MNKNTVWLLILLATGCLLRSMLINAPFTEDERKNVIIARTIVMDEQGINLPVEDQYVTHPLLNLYATKAGIDLLGDTVAGIRFFHFIFGSLTLLLIYLLAGQMGRKEALWAVLILALNQFHMHVSIKAENNSILFFLTALSIWVFYKSIQSERKRLFLCLGPLCGMAFLTKGISLLTPAAFTLFIILDKPSRRWLKFKETYWTVFLFFLTITPWIIWVLNHGSEQLIFNPDMYSRINLWPNRTAINFFLIEPLSWIEGVDYRMRISWEDAIVDGISGLMLLGGAVYSIQFVKERFFKLMYIIFLLNIIGLSFFKLPGLKWGEFWWASLSLIPAVCLTAKAIVYISALNKKFTYVFYIFGIYLFLNALYFVMTIEKYNYPPRRLSAYVDDDYITANIYTNRKEFDKAIKEMHRLLEKSPNDIETLSYLGWIYLQKNEYNLMMDAWTRALDIEPDYVHPYNLLFYMMDELILRYERDYQQGDPEAGRFYLGALYFYKQMYNEAFTEFQGSGKMADRTSRDLYYIGMTYLNTDRLNEALAVFVKVQSQEPDNFRIYTRIAECYEGLGRLEQASEYYKKGLSINPDDAKAYRNLAVVYQQLGKEKLALKQLHEAGRVYHDDIKYRFKLGSPYE